MGFESAKKMPSRTARTFAYILASYSLLLNRQLKKIVALTKSLKTAKQDERVRIANLIDEGAPHKKSECGNSCDAHIIVQFIRELKD